MCAGIEIFFDKWFKYKGRGPKSLLVEPFRIKFWVYSVGRTFICLTSTGFKSPVWLSIW
jgi:hypothetical protein